MEALSIPILLLSLAIVLALVIERLLEIIKSLYDLHDARVDLSSRWTRQAEQWRDRLESRLDTVGRGERQQFDLIMKLASRYLGDAAAGPGLSVSADRVRAIVLRSRFKLLGMLLGVGCAWLFDIDILELTRLSMQQAVSPGDYQPHWYGQLASGIAMGLGSGPIHKLITALEKARAMRRLQGERNNG